MLLICTEIYQVFFPTWASSVVVNILHVSVSHTHTHTHTHTLTLTHFDKLRAGRAGVIRSGMTKSSSWFMCLFHMPAQANNVSPTDNCCSSHHDYFRLGPLCLQHRAAEIKKDKMTCIFIYNKKLLCYQNKHSGFHCVWTTCSGKN